MYYAACSTQKNKIICPRKYIWTVMFCQVGNILVMQCITKKFFQDYMQIMSCKHPRLEGVQIERDCSSVRLNNYFLINLTFQRKRVIDAFLLLTIKFKTIWCAFKHFLNIQNVLSFPELITTQDMPASSVYMLCDYKFNGNSNYNDHCHIQSKFRTQKMRNSIQVFTFIYLCESRHLREQRCWSQ